MSDQKLFKVEVIELLLKNNKTARFGDLVSENQLISSSDSLKKSGYITTPTKSELESYHKKNKNLNKDVEEADKKAKEEADAKAKEEADKKAKEEADAKAKEEADKKAKEEADKK